MKALSSQDPRQLGRYRLVAAVGQGGMGRVLLGQAPTGRLVAVKQIHRHIAGSPEFRARFQREVALCRQVTGAYTAAVVDSDPESETPWLATEYIPGPSLDTVLRECGPMDLGGLRLLATGLASALLELDRAGLVHRDLKPANVLLAPDGPRVIDFGIARALEGDSKLTLTGSMIGSPAFMSPEQAEGHPPTAAADVFSVGAMLAMAATGASPFAGDSTPQILYNVMHSTPDTTGAPAGVRELIDACLDKDPARRPTAAELLDAAGAISAEPVWSAEISELVVTHRADAEWWIESAARDTRNRAQLDAARQQQRRTIKRIAAAAAAVLFLVGSAVVANQWAGTSGHATAMTTPTVSLTAAELRLVDACELMKNTVVKGLGKTVSEPDPYDGPQSCQANLTDASGKELTFKLEIGRSISEAKMRKQTTGDLIDWMPVLGNRKETSSCERAVITQGVEPLAIELSSEVPDGNACPGVEQGLTTVVRRLAVNPPLLQTSSESILQVDPCALVNRKAALSAVGDPAIRTLKTPHTCVFEGADYDLTVFLGEGLRPDNGVNHSKKVRIGGVDAYVDANESVRIFQTCTISYLSRPTAGSKAEIMSINVAGLDYADGTCLRAEQAFAAAVSELPK
ncbi:serine/threonine-protein kinase [Nocardia jejuensis]|uniref:serine/threonine-protein kinase n=1 Tax=Nocardia jejuensis TaxID=328049 RepID=UPI000836DB78|nr:serine/threonine-protein kinase [Nocardia jejuensis]